MNDLDQAFLRERKLEVVQVSSPRQIREIREAFPHQHPLFVREYEGQSVLGQEPAAPGEERLFRLLVTLVASGAAGIFILRSLGREPSALWKAIGFTALSGAGLGVIRSLAGILHDIRK